jgi:hypothetical protein
VSPIERYQRELLDYVYAPRQGSLPPSLAAQAASPDRLGLGLTIHRRNLVFGLCRAMAETYPLCRDLLGEGNFNFLCKQYIHRFPSRVRDLSDYGERLGDFLAGREEVRDHPFLADLARLEWLAARALRLPPSAGLEKGGLSLPANRGARALPADRGARAHRLARLRRRMLLLRTRFAILEAWRDYRDGGLEAIRAGTLRRGTQHLVVWSRSGQPHAAEVDPQLWREIAAGGTGADA